MPLIVLSDIHGNLEALKAVLEDAGKLTNGRSTVVCLGDMVGYGADPEEVVRAMRKAGALAVLGNHEVGVLRPDTRDRFNSQAWEAVRWAASRLTAESSRWLASLKVSLVVQGCRFVHGLPPDDVDTYLFQASPERVRRAMARLSEDVCFVGHTHLLGLTSLAGGELRQSLLKEGSRVLEPGERHLVNAGAVGQPRDGDPRAKYCLFDPASRELTVRFVSYDARKAAGKILEAGQPRIFAERLLMGGA